MTDDLVKRLRQWDCGESTWGLLESAADRIEKLEAALRELLSLGDWGTNALARTIILEALEAKD
jgi:hypothetical protein